MMHEKDALKRWAEVAGILRNVKAVTGDPCDFCNRLQGSGGCPNCMMYPEICGDAFSIFTNFRHHLKQSLGLSQEISDKIRGVEIKEGMRKIAKKLVKDHKL